LGITTEHGKMIIISQERLWRRNTVALRSSLGTLQVPSSSCHLQTWSPLWNCFYL